MALTVEQEQAANRARIHKLGTTKGEHGATGTPNYGGYISGVDYNPKLDGKQAIAVYDEMRNDGMAQAILRACKEPILSANAEVRSSEKGDNRDKEIAEHCRSALLDGGAFAKPMTWRRTLQHLLTRLEFGVAVLEKVWKRRADGKHGFHKLAPRLAKTVERWNVDDVGDLLSIDQYAYRNGQYVPLTIPASYAVVSVNDREGDNWWGRSILRAAYPHWYFKTHLYRIDGVKHDRWGVGIPRATINPAANPSDDELAKIDKTLKGMRTHEAAWIRTTTDVVYDILTPAGGQAGAAGLMDSVDHHNRMIAASILAAFLVQGEQKHGSFGLGDRLAKFFTSTLESIADDICSDINAQVIEPLCTLNFDMTNRPFPSLVMSDIADIDIEMLAGAMQKFGAKYITPEDTLEDFLRKTLGLPPLPEEARGRDRLFVPSGFDPGQEGDEPPTPKKEPKPKKRPEPSLRLRARYVDDLTGQVYARQPTDFELAIFALRHVPARLDQETAALVAEMARVRREQLAKIAAQITRKDGRDTGAFTDIRPDEIDLPGLKDLERVIKQAQQRAFDYGAQQVLAEAGRQGVVLMRRATWDALALDTSAGAGRSAARSAMVTSAKVTAEKVSDAWYARILETALRERRTGVQGEDLEAAILAALQEEAEASTTRDAKAEVNEAFALGRATEASKQSDEIETVIYSCLLDSNSCGDCEAIDGEEMAFGSERYFETMPPFKDCQGRDLCRCVHLFKFKGAK